MAIQKGTGFTNLNRVMQASRGNKLGQTVAGGIQGQAQGVQSQVKSAQQQFQEEAQKGRLDTQEAAQKRQEVLGRFAPQSGATGVQQQGQPAQSPVSEQEIKDFTKYRTGTYTGPKELQNSEALYGKAQQAEQLGGLAKSEGGRQELLRRFVGGRDYTQGQRQLDTSILGQQPGQLGQAARQTRGATQQVSQANIQAGNLAQEYANRAKGFGEETQKLIGETKAPLSSEVEKKVSQAQQAEQSRLANLKDIQDMLVGTGEEVKGLDKLTRAGLALQDAANAGYLSQGDINMLMGTQGKTGLLQRGMNLGLDVNQLINERITNQIAQNISRTGVASQEDIARLNALDRLAGKTGTDLEFLQGQGKFQAGKTGLNIKSLEDYIAKTEGERALSDQAYADQLTAEKARYLNQALAYGAGAVGAGQGILGNAIGTDTGMAGLAGAAASKYAAQQAAAQAARAAAYEGSGSLAASAAAAPTGTGIAAGGEYGGAMLIPGSAEAGAASGMNLAKAGAPEAFAGGAEGVGAEAAAAEGGAGLAGMGAGPAALAAMIAMDVATGKDTTAQTANLAGTGAIAAQGAGAQGQNAILEGLTKLNIGGKSIANTEAGKQLLKAIAYKSQLENKMAGEQKQALDEVTGGFGDITKSALHDPFNQKMQNLVTTGGTSMFQPTAKRIAQNLNTEIAQANQKAGLGVVNKAASDAVKAIGPKAVSKSVGGAVKTLSGGGVKISDEDLKTDIEYNPKDLQRFMDRIKPAAYDYKEEVQDSPLASKNRELGVMAQDLEKSKLGKESVQDTGVGKVVDYDNLEPKMLASIAALNQRLKELEKKK